jgi:hypothetical protein
MTKAMAEDPIQIARG